MNCKVELTARSVTVLLVALAAPLVSDDAHTETLEERITRIEDHLAIEQAHARYAYALNTSDADGYAALFAEDGVLICCGTTVDGREAIHKFIADFAARRDDSSPLPIDTQGRQFGRVRHIVSSIKIDFTGADSARVESYFQEVNNGQGVEAGAPAVTLLRRYEDEWVKQNGQWLIKTRMTAE